MESIEEKIVRIWDEEHGDFDVELDGIEEIEHSPWEHEYKQYYNSYQVLKDISTGQHYMVSLSRVGDENWGYEFSIVSIHKVRPVQKIINSWMESD